MSRPKLLLLLAPADHPHRDPVCATLAWLAPEQGRQLECYFAGPASGGHFGGGHPATARPEDLRGGTLTGGHHLEQFYRLLIEFEVEAAVLGGSPFDELLAPLGVPVLARSADVAEFYLQLMDGLGGDFPERLLLVGDGGRPQAVPLAAYAYPEIVNRRQLAISDSDPEAFRRLCEGLQVESLWPSR
ncbi:MAG: hypothetical protein J2P45_13360, partial [Candidatus Dormibacteraeota bacterium]|nr:hypothetical protein [Candidatus Dormibacteraeota bacterium]